MEGFMKRINENNMGLEELPTLTPFVIDGKAIGQLKPRCDLMPHACMKTACGFLPDLKPRHRRQHQSVSPCKRRC